MADRENQPVHGLGWFPHDLLGHPVPANKGAKGRPQHAPTAEKLEIAIGLYAEGHGDRDVAAALGISVPTLRAHYFSHPELKALRRKARMVVKGRMVHALFKAVEAGKVGAIDKVLKRLDRADQAELARRMAGLQEERPKPKPAPLGKKEAAVRAAKEVRGKFAPPDAPLLN